jgi:alpha-beta hydrolase superfamily lysophospholipase
MSIFESYWIKVPWWSLRKVTYLIWISFLGTLIIGFVLFTLYMKSVSPLSTWHTTELKNEFTADSNVEDFDDYIALEKKLFHELESEVYDKVLETEQNSVNRYTKNSFSNPERWSKAWNRSFELPVENPKMGILLLHGMSDSPYSLHTQAEYLHKQGVWVVALRMPGHGTIPSGLTRIKWQDMAAVVKIGMRRLTQKLGDKPIHIMGYSAGAALALNYTFTALKDPALTLPSSLIFYSPAIGVSKAAPLAIWQSRIGHFFSLPKLEWNAIAPEYDPFKYNSFAVNAGDQVYRLCREVQKQFDDYHKETKHTKKFPPVLSFQSIIDKTVSVSDIVNHLYKRLPEGQHTLVMFDINNNFSSNLLVKEQVSNNIHYLKENSGASNFQFDLISDMNSTEGTLQLIRNKKMVKELPYTWPKELFSLSHLAMPTANTDPLYGDKNAPESPGIKLGHLAVYGESSVLEVTPSAILRLRWNPFHAYTKERVLEFLELQ